MDACVDVDVCVDEAGEEGVALSNLALLSKSGTGGRNYKSRCEVKRFYGEYEYIPHHG
jgi:hypothetical protein